MQDYLVSLLSISGNESIVGWVEAENQEKAIRILAKGWKQPNPYHSKVLTRGQSWPRSWRGAKYYPPNGWQKK